MRERAFSDLADAAGGAARINNICFTHGFLPKRRLERLAPGLALYGSGSSKRDCERYVA